MPWWVQKSTNDLRKADTSPGSGWIQIPGAADTDTEQQAGQQFLNDVVAGDFGTSWNPVTNVANAAGISSPFTSIEHGLSAFYDVLTNGKMWRSLGWLALGIVLMLAGLGWWLKGATPAGQIVSAVRGT